MQAEVYDDRLDVPIWRQPAPVARRVAMFVYGWQDPAWVFLLAVLGATPFVIATLIAPSLLSLSPTVEMVGPIADARAVAGGAADLSAAREPFYTFLLMLADRFAESPGRIHLGAKAVAAVLAAYPLAYFASVRLPTLQVVLLTAAVAAFIVAPYSGAPEMALAYFIVLSVALILKPADEAADRAMIEGLLCGGVMYALWTFNPIFTLAGFLVLSACPFLTGKSGLVRYVATLGALAAMAVMGEMLSPGLNLARATAASGLFADGAQSLMSGLGGWGLAGIGVSTLVVILSAAVFGGREYFNGWLAAIVFLAASLAAANLAGAQPVPLFVFAAAMAAFSVVSPFYDGVFRDHDRASVSVAVVAGALTVFWTAAIFAHTSGQLALQYKAAAATDSTVRSEFALVHPGGDDVARWIEEGRFSTRRAREMLTLTPVDQSTVLLEAVARARTIADDGIDVAFLTAADTACVLAAMRTCRQTGKQAANDANVVFVPRIDLDPATITMKASAEALLYTEFKLTERTQFWEVWVRRGVTLPSDLVVVGRGL